MTRDEMLRAARDRQIIEKRLEDYAKGDIREERKKLVELWKSHMPEAAAETWQGFRPLALVFTKQPGEPAEDADEQWTNDEYFVTLRRHAKDPVFGTRGGMIQLGICNWEGTAKHDWRDLQAIKNQLAGDECEAFELYPAESRLLDPSNYYTLWCFPGVKALKVGYGRRDVRGRDEAYASQRGFAAGAKTGTR
jgi:hypothetical protein